MQDSRLHIRLVLLASSNISCVHSMIVLNRLCFHNVLFNIFIKAYIRWESTACTLLTWSLMSFLLLQEISGCSYFSLNLHNYDNISMREGRSWERFLCDVRSMWMVQSEFPFRQQRSRIAKHNKGLIHWRKWEHVTIRAWERSRTGTPAWPSSDSQPTWKQWPWQRLSGRGLLLVSMWH